MNHVWVTSCFCLFLSAVIINFEKNQKPKLLDNKSNYINLKNYSGRGLYIQQVFNNKYMLPAIFHVPMSNGVPATLTQAPFSVCKGLIIYTVDCKGPLALLLPLPVGPFQAH